MTAMAASGRARRGDFGEVIERVEQVVGQIDAHDAAHLAALDRHQDQRFLGHEAENGWQRRDHGAGTVEIESRDDEVRHVP